MKLAHQPDVLYALLDSFPHLIAILTAEGTIVEVNDAWRKSAVENGAPTNWSGIGSNYLSVCRAANDSLAWEIAAGIEQVINGQLEKYSCRYPCHFSDRRGWFHLWVTPLHHGLVLVVHDNITALNEAEYELQRLNRQLTELSEWQVMLLDHLPALIGYWDRDLRNRFANKAYVEWFGRTPSEIRGMHIRDVIGAHLFALNKPYIEGALNGNAQLFDREIVDSTGNVRYSQASYIPDFDAAGKTKGFFVLVTDITQRRQTEIDLRAAHNTLANQHILLSQQHRELLAYRDETEAAHRITEKILARMVAHGRKSDASVSWIQAAERFSGDMVATTRAQNGNIYLLLADAAGHGLAAAFCLMPVLDVFYGLAQQGYCVASIVAEMNRRIKATLPTDRFVAATLACIDPFQNTLEVWNGGNPPALLFDRDGRVLHTFFSRHLALGILQPSQFDATTEHNCWQHPTRLMFFSDGVVEVTNHQGERFGMERIESVLAAPSVADVLTQLRAAVTAFLGSAAAHDDLSVVIADCIQQERPNLSLPALTRSTGFAATWQLTMECGVDPMRRPDWIATILQAVKLMGLSEDLLVRLNMAVTELLTNALDHGILGLDSAIKYGEDGFEHYFALRQERLEQLQAGHIKVKFRGHRYRVEVTVEDSGHGFDFSAYCRPAVNSTRLYGRGIMLVLALCQRVEYRGCGNEVVVEIYE